METIADLLIVLDETQFQGVFWKMASKRSESLQKRLLEWRFMVQGDSDRYQDFMKLSRLAEVPCFTKIFDFGEDVFNGVNPLTGEQIPYGFENPDSANFGFSEAFRYHVRYQVKAGRLQDSFEKEAMDVLIGGFDNA